MSHDDLMRDRDDLIRSKGKSLDDLVEEWHDNDDPRPLHEYLGMTWEQYSEWTQPKIQRLPKSD